MNATQYTTRTPADRYAVDFSDGQSKYFAGLSASYCANDAERDGFMAAARQAAHEVEQGVWCDAELEARRSRDLEVDAAQGEYSDWRWA